MPLVKISEPVKKCIHPEHNPPMHIYLEPGTYKYICPACGEITEFTVPDISCKYEEVKRKD